MTRHTLHADWDCEDRKRYSREGLFRSCSLARCMLQNMRDVARSSLSE
jgi:hypothetical protein